jgi:heme-degrading monooxygenase HmoA
MFVHMSIHHPRPGKEELLIDSMHRFGEAMKNRPGLQQAQTLKDQKTGHLIGLAIWDTKEAWLKARPAMLEAVKDDDFESWEEEPPVVYHLEVV